MQFVIYVFIGGVSALVNLAIFLVLLATGVPLTGSTVVAFILAAATNYLLCVALLFRHKARWNSTAEILVYGSVVIVAGGIDLGITRLLYTIGHSAWFSKAIASFAGLVFNFVGRRVWVFPEERSRRRISL
jgi:putative flippase GtrA